MATFVSVETITINTGERMMLTVISNVEDLMKLLRPLIIHLNLVADGGQMPCMQVSEIVTYFKTASLLNSCVWNRENIEDNRFFRFDYEYDLSKLVCVVYKHLLQGRILFLGSLYLLVSNGKVREFWGRDWFEIWCSGI